MARRPARSRIFLTSRQQSHTYGELYEFSERFRNLIVGSVQVEDPVYFVCDSSDLLVMSVAACWLNDIPFFPIHPGLPTAKIAEYLEMFPDSPIFVDDADDLAELDLKDRVIELDSIPDAPKAEKPGPAKIDKERIFGYFLTSGTTGRSKVVPLKRRQMIAGAQASARNFKPESDHYWLQCMPFNHVGGVSVVLRSLLYGSAIYRMSRFDKDEVERLFREEPRLQVASLVPTMLKRLMNSASFMPHDGFKAILLGGGPIAPNLVYQCKQRGVPVVPSFGMTETCAQIVSVPLKKRDSIPDDSVGRVFAGNKIQIRKNKNVVAETGEEGNIWLYGKQIFDDYIGAYQKKFFDDEGWFNTGDWGRKDRQGNLFVLSRRTDLIVTGGENVNPYEVEEVLSGLEGIGDCAVIGLPDEEWGQIVTACVVPADNRNHPHLNYIRDRLRNFLPGYKLPHKLFLLESIPKTPGGKIKRLELTRTLRRIRM